MKQTHSKHLPWRLATLRKLNRETNCKIGLSAEQMAEIQNDPSLRVELSMTGTYATAFLQHTADSPAYQHQIAKQCSMLEMYKEYDIDGEAIFAENGIPSGIDLLDYSIHGIPYDQLVFKNYATLLEQQEQMAAEYLAPYLFLGCLLLMLILLSLLLSTVTRSKIAYKQYATMCAVGMTHKQSAMLMLWENIRFGIQYLLYGILLGSGVIIAVSIITKTAIEISVMLRSVLRISGLVAIGLLVVAVVSALISAHLMRSVNIVGAMNNDAK